MAINHTPLLEGTRLRSRYIIRRLLGGGGMGAVYLADDTNLHISVAIKENFANDPELQEAFIREARILSKLRHISLPRCLEHFSENGRQFLVMEFISGDDLETLLKRNKQPFEYTIVLKWAEQLLDALTHMHSSNPPIIHRDIKPLNIMLTPQGQIILLDFGLAKGATGNTTRGLFGLTADYSPLEQLRDERTDARSDLFSLAVSLYRFVTGVIPPNAEIRDAAVRLGRGDPLRPAIEVNPRIPLGFSHALTQAMALHSSARFNNAEAFRTALHSSAKETTAQPHEKTAIPHFDASDEQSTLIRPERRKDIRPVIPHQVKIRPASEAVSAHIPGVYNAGFIVTGDVVAFDGQDTYVAVNPSGKIGFLYFDYISWEVFPGRVNSPKNVFNIGDTILIKVVGDSGDFFWLNFRELSPDPWDTVSLRFKVGMIVRVGIRLTTWGRTLDLALVELEPGVYGEMSIDYLSTDIREKLDYIASENRTIKTKILSIDPKAREIRFEFVSV